MHKCIMVKIGENKKRKLIENRGQFITFAEIVGNLLYAPLTYADGRLCSIFSTFPSTSYSPHPSIPIPPHAPHSYSFLLQLQSLICGSRTSRKTMRQLLRSIRPIIGIVSVRIYWTNPTHKMTIA